MVFIATFNNISAISWRSVLLVEETGVLGENPTTCAISADHHLSCEFRSGSQRGVLNTSKSNYHTITITTIHWIKEKRKEMVDKTRLKTKD
jgi:hypothetical protein